MNSGKYVFAQLLHFVDRYEFDKCVSKYNGDFRTRDFNCWNQFIQLFFGQLTCRNSLRDICVCLKAHQSKLYHLGIRGYVNQSTLSRANENRNCRIFEDFGKYLIEKVRPMYSNDSIANVDIDNEIFALDSTTISLSLKLFSWAPGKYSRGIWVAISTYLIVASVKHTLKSNLSIYEILQILGISAFDKTPLKELLTQDQINQNVKELNDLFNFKT